MKRYVNTALLYAILAMVEVCFIGSLPNSMVLLPRPPSPWYIPIIF